MKPYLKIILPLQNRRKKITSRVFLIALQQYRRTLDIEKTEALIQDAPNTNERVQLKYVEGFKYLHSTISNDGSLDSKILFRINKVSQAYGRMKVKVIQQKRHHTKLKIYMAVVVFQLYPTDSKHGSHRLAYHDARKLSHKCALCRIIVIRQKDIVTN